jgi:DNA recombination protein RmuC
MVLVVLAVIVLVLVVITAAVVVVVIARGADRRAVAERQALDDLRRQLLDAQARQALASVDTVVAVAGEKFADHTSAASRELDLRAGAINEQFREMQAELSRVRSLVTDLERSRAEQHGRLEHGLAEAVQASRTLTDTTQSLREALSSTKARGQWGERMADDVLRLAGFVEGVNYRKQTAVAGGGIPDVTFLLPQGRVMHMDVKFPLDNYLRALQADHDAERTRHEAQFLKDVRHRVREIAGRAYIDPDETVDAVLLFIPNEALYGFIHERDPELVDVALRQKVVLCSPFTLFAVLAVVRQAVDAFLLERTGDEIVEALSAFSGQWEKFSTGFDTLGKRLETAQKAYDDLAGTRRRQLDKQLDRIEDLRCRRGLPTTEADRGVEPGPTPTPKVDDDQLDDPAATGTTGPAPHLRPVRLG